MFDRVTALTPGDAEAHFNRGFLLQELNDHDGAIAAFRHALAINPDHDRALYGLALSLISTRHLEEAIAPLKRNTKLQPMSPYGWYQLARVQHELGRRRRSAGDARSPGQIRARGRASARAGNRTEGGDPGLSGSRGTTSGSQSRQCTAASAAGRRPAACACRKDGLYSAAIGRSALRGPGGAST